MHTKGKGLLILLLIGIFITIYIYIFSASASNGAYSSQITFNLDLDNPVFRFEQNQFNDSSYSKEYTYNTSGNFSFWIELPKNSTINKTSMNLTGTIRVNVTNIGDHLYKVDIGNITDNAGNEVVISSFAPGDNNTRVYDTNKNFLWGYDADYDFVYDVEIGDIELDSINEVVIGSDGFLTVLNSSGGQVWNNSIGEVKSVAIGNITSDSGNEIVAGFSDIYVLNATGDIVLNYSDVSDVYGIGIGEVVASSEGNEIAIGTGGTDDKVYLMNYTNDNLTEIWNYSAGGDIYGVKIGNVTSDSGDEVVAVSGGTDKKVIVLNSSGDLVWNYSLNDIGNDVAIGEVVSSHPGNEIVVATGGGDVDDRIYILNSSGQLILSYPADNYVRGIAIGNITSDSGSNENETLAVAAGGYVYELNYDNFPTNLTLYVGDEAGWNYTEGDGRLRGSTNASGFEQKIQDFLDNDTLCSGDTCNVSIVIHSDTQGILNISDLNITYDYNASPNINNVTVYPQAWSRNYNVSANESIVSEAINISYTNPAIDIEIWYIKINSSATSCGLKNSTYSNVTLYGANYCNVSDENIVVSVASGHASTLLWDNKMRSDIPIFIYEDAPYNTTGIDNNYWRKNFTISSNASEMFRNISANITVNDSIIHGDAFLNVTWGGTVYNITPSTTCPEMDSSLPLNFIGCKNDTDNNGIIDLFNFTQPNISAMSDVEYQAGGSRNLRPNLSDANVTPSSGFWGEDFNFSVYVNDTEDNDVNVTLWFYFNLSNSWANMGTENITGNGTVYFNLTSNRSWVGLDKFKFEYQDFNSSGDAMHSTVNTSEFAEPDVLRHNVTVTPISGNNSVVYRENGTMENDTVLLEVLLNDTTDYDNWTDMNCTFWVTKNNGSGYDSGNISTINDTGYCNITFDPDGNYTVGQQIWNATVNDPYYNMTDWENFTINVTGYLNITPTKPSIENQSIVRNTQGLYEAKLIDEYGVEVNLPGYTCTWYFNETDEMGENQTNATGYCNLTWTPNCSYQNLGEYILNITFNGSEPEYYTILGNETSISVVLTDNSTIVIDSPISYSIFNKDDNVSLNSTVNDTCGTWNINPYNVTWYFSWMYKFNVTFNETLNLNRTNEVIKLNGSELFDADVNLSRWKVNSTRIVCEGENISAQINNASNEYMETGSEIIFLLNVSANQTKTCEFYFDTEDVFSNTSISFIRNGGFETGDATGWLTSGPTGIITENVSNGTYSYRVGNYSKSPGQINQSFNLTSSHIHMWIRARYEDEGTVVVAVDNGSVNILEKWGDDSSEEANVYANDTGWIERNYNVSNFTGVVTLIITANASIWPDGDKSEVYVDNICMSDSNGTCTSYDPGSRIDLEIKSKTLIGSEQNSSWVVLPSHDVGLRTIIAKINGSYYIDSKNSTDVYIYGWSNVSNISFSPVVPGECVNTTCLVNASLTLYCLVTDANTSAGIYNYTTWFFDNGTEIGNSTTNQSGFAEFLWENSTDVEGEHEIKCNISDSAETYYNITQNNSMSINITFSGNNTNGSLNVTPIYKEATNMTKTHNATVDFNLTINNTGNSTMYGISIFVYNKTNFTSSYNVCTSLNVEKTCNGTLSFEVSRLADLGNTSINVSLRWSNPEGDFENRTVTIDVKNTTVLNIIEDAINITVAFGGSSSENITVEAFGNTPLNNVNLSLTGGDISTVEDWISFSPNDFVVPRIENASIEITVTVPDNSSNMGNYTVYVLANDTGSGCSGAYDNCTDYVTLNITVTEQNWRVTPIEDDMIVAGISTNNLGYFDPINVTNLENYNLTINITLSYGNVSTTTGEMTPNESVSKFFNTTFIFNNSVTQLPSDEFINITNLSSGLINVTYNTTNASSDDFGRYYINISTQNMNASGVPTYFNLTRLLEISQLEIVIISPNSSSPMTNVNISNVIEIIVNVTYNIVEQITENMTWYAEIGDVECTIINSTNITGDLWNITCEAPEIPDNPINNTLLVSGNYTTQNMVFNATQDQEGYTVYITYRDITPPQVWSIDLFVDGNSSLTADNDPNIHYQLENVTNITVRVNVTDNAGVKEVWANVTDPDENVSIYNLTLSNALWEFNYTNPKVIGDYRIVVNATDVNNWTNSTENLTIGYFDVYKPIQFIFNSTDADGNAFTANLTFYKPSTSWEIAENSSSGAYNFTIHDRSYDIIAGVFDYSVKFYNANITASAISQFNTSTPDNITNAFMFHNFADKNADDISNIDLPNTAENILLAFVIEATYLSYSNALINITYTDALSAGSFEEGDLRIFYCDNWNFYSMTCPDGEFGRFNNENDLPNVSANTFSFTASPGTAYAIAESCYPNICGESPPTDGGDGVSTGGGGGIAPVCGNGVCEAGENEINCPEDCLVEVEEEAIFEIKTAMAEVRIFPGQNKTYPLWITNKMNKSITIQLSVEGSIAEFLSFKDYTVDVTANDTETTDIYIITYPESQLGTYTGNIVAEAEGVTKKLPLTLIITQVGEIALDLVVETRTRQITPSDTLQFYIAMYNIGLRKEFDTNLTYVVTNIETGRNITIGNETVNIKTTRSFIKNIPLGDFNLSIGHYVLEVIAEYEDGSTSSTDSFEIVKSFWTQERIILVLIVIFITAAVVGGYYGWKRYKKWKLMRARYVFPVDYRKLPKETKESFWIGKVAETDKKAFFSPKELTTHILIAGATGSGKSVGASIFAEEALKRDIPVIVFDPTAQWTGFVRPCRDKNLLMYYPEFGIKREEAKPFKGMIFEVTDPKVKIDFKKLMKPGEITVFTLNKLKPGQYDEAVINIINTIFGIRWEESTELEMIVVFDEVHRLLEKYGGKGGYVALEKACREFRKWGIGLIMASQVSSDFKEAIMGNVLTEIQLNTKSLTDIKKIGKKYGELYASRIAHEAVGVGLIQNPKYNKGKPYFINFRPTLHSPHKISEVEMEQYKKYSAVVAKIEKEINKIKKRGIDVVELELELGLVKDKLKEGRFRMVEIYVNLLKKKLKI